MEKSKAKAKEKKKEKEKEKVEKVVSSCSEGAKRGADGYSTTGR